MSRSLSTKIPLPSELCSALLGEKPYPKQAEIMDAIYYHPRVAIAAANGVGKTWAAARIAIWFMLCFPKALVVTTAPTYRQVRYLLWRELHTALGRLAARGYSIGKVLTTSWQFKDRLAIGFAASEYKADRFQGLHSPNMLVIVDEASGLSWTIYEQIMATLRGANACLLMIGNPLLPSGPFYEAFHDPTFKTFRLSAFDCINVIEKRIVVPGLVTWEDIERDRISHGEDSVFWKTRILAEFPEAEQGALLTKADLERAAKLTFPDVSEHPVVLGVDVGHGGHRTAVAFVQGPLAYNIESWKSPDLMEAVERIVEFAHHDGAKAICVDATGLGAGVVDRLKQVFRGNVIPILPGAKPKNQAYQNLRTELWVSLAERIKMGKIGGPVFAHPEVQRDLLSASFRISQSGKIALESKRDGERSPDLADALAYAYSLVEGLQEPWKFAEEITFELVSREQNPWSVLR